MKLKVLTLAAAAAMVAGAYGQSVLMQNTVNTGAIGAPSNGLIYTNRLGVTGIADLFNNNVGVEISGGPTGGSLTPMGLGTYRASNDPKGYTGFDYGKFQLGNAAINVPGVAAGGVAQIQLNMWFDGAAGLFSSYALASAGGGLVGQAFWLNQPTGNAGASPPVVPQAFGNMPSITLAVVPEPSTLALAGLGLASLFLYRRRN